MINEIPQEILEKIHLMAESITEKLWDIVEITRPITIKHLEDHEGSWNESDQYCKIHEETVESKKATDRNLPDKNKEHLDIFFSWLTLIHNKKMTKRESYGAVFADLVKFHQRGWLF